MADRHSPRLTDYRILGKREVGDYLTIYTVEELPTPEDGATTDEPRRMGQPPTETHPPATAE